MNFSELRACLEKDGWPIEDVSEVTLRSCFRGGGRMFPVFIYREPEHVTFAVIPFLHLMVAGLSTYLLCRTLGAAQGCAASGKSVAVSIRNEVLQPAREPALQLSRHTVIVSVAERSRVVDATYVRDRTPCVTRDRRPRIIRARVWIGEV